MPIIAVGYVVFKAYTEAIAIKTRQDVYKEFNDSQSYLDKVNKING